MQNIIILTINSFTFFQDHTEHGCPPLQLHRAEEFFLGRKQRLHLCCKDSKCKWKGLISLYFYLWLEGHFCQANLYFLQDWTRIIYMHIIYPYFFVNVWSYLFLEWTLRSDTFATENKVSTDDIINDIIFHNSRLEVILKNIDALLSLLMWNPCKFRNTIKSKQIRQWNSMERHE